MAIEYTKQKYGSSKGILVFPDHYVAYGQIFTKDHALAQTIGGRKIVEAGTIYPSNDANAIGIVLNDLDVTNGDQNGAIVIHGFVKIGALPAIPSANAMSALKGIQFLPLVQTAGSFSVPEIATFTVGDAVATTGETIVKLAGDTFRAAATTVAKWVLTGDTTAKVKIDSIELIDSKTVKLIFETTATAVEGDVTVIPDASVTGLGATVSTGFKVAQVLSA